AVVAARFNEAISKKLADGAVAAFTAAGIGGDRIEVHWVPGSFELPLAALTLARSGRFAGIACVGVVIKGGTPHFDFICREAASGIREASLTTGVPIGFGVITALTEEQAWERAGGSVGNRGEEAALAVLEMAEWLRGRSRPRRGRLMGKRRKARELALQLLYQLDLQEAPSAEPYFDEFWARHPVDGEVRAFVESLVRGTMLHQEKIDEVIAQYAENWDMDRMAVV